ncbi:hypothetical protein LEMA_P121360.1 [Plenodomus lingam JN3]|uniref:Uncharacterized protein n=2 Tax=Leptosphaeria maculans TaxID=5022 RepID=E4ZSJ2_LEPMJ|nr:hypothetical protein LEMA_P121360.1 [Plenodomus lingam JN3]CBX94372.1 hypothetical protein LEMA_P121360.1 [Plenodomus lingam JN3]
MSTPSFLSLPVELRELIYGFIFSSYTIRHGFKQPGGSRDAPWTEDANSDPLPSTRTALLLTSQQIYTESWRHLPQNVTLHFRGTEDLLHTLFSLDQSTLTHLRHIRLRGYPFPLYPSGRADYYPTYYAANALSLFPGLCLDTLTVEDCWHGFGMGDGWRDLTTYFDIEALLKSDGWRELLYITPCTDFIASGYDGRRKRKVQPQTWDDMLKERDDGEGGGGGAQVQMWIVPFNQQDGAVLAGPRPPAALTPISPPTTLTTIPTDPTKTEDGRAMYPWAARPGHEIAENWRLGTPDQEVKGEVRIRARRAKRARVVQLGLARRAASWEELKARKGGFAPLDWSPYHNDMADAVGWIYGGWGRRMQLANAALSS